MLKLTFIRACTVSIALFACAGCVGAPEDSELGAAAPQSSQDDPTGPISIGDQPSPTVVAIANEDTLIPQAKGAQKPGNGGSTAAARANVELLPAPKAAEEPGSGGPTAVGRPSEHTLLPEQSDGQKPGNGGSTAVANGNEQLLPVLSPCGDGYCPPDAPTCTEDDNGEPACVP